MLDKEVVNMEMEMLNTLFKNAIRFLNISIDEIIQSDFNNIDHVIKTAILIQTTVELSLKYASVYNLGDISIKRILTKDLQMMPIEEIYTKFLNNTLKINEFENSKNYIKKIRSFKFDKNEEIKYMDKFQKIRNCILHFTYNFDSAEMENIQETFIYIIIRIVFPLLYEGYSEEALDYLTPNDFLKIYVGEEKFLQLRTMKEYKKVMLQVTTNMEAKGDVSLGKCIYCGESSWLKENSKCILCGRDDGGHIFLKCSVCQSDKSVAYDPYNMDCNNNASLGSCISCGSKLSVIKCKKCGRYKVYEDKLRFYYAIEGLEESVCRYDCVKLDKKNKLPHEYAYVIPALVLSTCISNNEILVVNPYKNPIRIFGKKTLDEYLITSDIDIAVKKSLAYLVQMNYVRLLISYEGIQDKINEVIKSEYFCGSFEEIQGLYKKLFINIHGIEKVNRFGEIYQKACIQRDYKITLDDFQILYDCRDYLSIDDKIFFRIYSDALFKPNEIK